MDLPPQLPSLPPPLPRKNKKTLLWLALGIVAAFFVVLVVVSISWGVLKVAQQQLTHPPETAWKTTHLKGFTLDTPFALTEETMSLKESLRDLTLYRQMVTGDGYGVEATAALVIYKTDTTLELPEVENLLKSLAKNLGTEIPKHIITEITISGLPARKITATFKGHTKVTPVQVIHLVSNSTLAQVILLQTSPASQPAATMERIMNSVSFTPTDDTAASAAN